MFAHLTGHTSIFAVGNITSITPPAVTTAVAAACLHLCHPNGTCLPRQLQSKRSLPLPCSFLLFRKVIFLCLGVKAVSERADVVSLWRSVIESLRCPEIVGSNLSRANVHHQITARSISLDLQHTGSTCSKC